MKPRINRLSLNRAYRQQYVAISSNSGRLAYLISDDRDQAMLAAQIHCQKFRQETTVYRGLIGLSKGKIVYKGNLAIVHTCRPTQQVGDWYIPPEMKLAYDEAIRFRKSP